MMWGGVRSQVVEGAKCVECNPTRSIGSGGMQREERTASYIGSVEWRQPSTAQSPATNTYRLWAGLILVAVCKRTNYLGLKWGLLGLFWIWFNCCFFCTESTIQTTPKDVLQIQLIIIILTIFPHEDSLTEQLIKNVIIIRQSFNIIMRYNKLSVKMSER